MDKLQFRVLYREFLFRMFDLELLSADALGDANKLLGRFAALLVFISIFLAAHALKLAGSHAPSALRLLDALRYEHFLIATTMLVVGLFAVLSWDSTFPDRRDVLVLAPLPIRARTVFLAKVSAIATALGTAVVLLHAAAGLVWPFVLGTPAPLSFPALTGFAAVTIPASDGTWDTIRTFLAYWTAMLAAGLFVFSSLLGVQGLAAQLLPRRLFLRVSSFLQLAAFCIIVGVYFLEPLVPTVPVLIAANGHGLLAWSPSYWFLGFFQQLNGSPALAPLARRAWLSLAVAAAAPWSRMRCVSAAPFARLSKNPILFPAPASARGCPASAAPSKRRSCSSACARCCAAVCTASFSPSTSEWGSRSWLFC